MSSFVPRDPLPSSISHRLDIVPHRCTHFIASLIHLRPQRSVSVVLPLQQVTPDRIDDPLAQQVTPNGVDAPLHRSTLFPILLQRVLLVLPRGQMGSAATYRQVVALRPVDVGG